jgi:hypothetical protein
MRALKVALFINFLYFGIIGLVALIAPNQVNDFTGSDDPHTRIAAAGLLGLAIGLWLAFRNPLKNRAVIVVAISWLIIEALISVVNSIIGDMAWGDTVFTIIVDVILAGALAYFYPRGETTS